jgi:hypothetical protein
MEPSISAIVNALNLHAASIDNAIGASLSSNRVGAFFPRAIDSFS